MSAATLRTAATLMRERAEAAESAVGGGFWNWNTGWCDPHGTTYAIGNPAGGVADALYEEVAEYLCPLRPSVAKSLADLLDALALDREDPYLPKHFDEAALAVAATYLGTQP